MQWRNTNDGTLGRSLVFHGPTVPGVISVMKTFIPIFPMQFCPRYLNHKVKTCPSFKKKCRKLWTLRLLAESKGMGDMTDVFKNSD